MADTTGGRPDLLNPGADGMVHATKVGLLRVLGPAHVWALGVGIVLVGEWRTPYRHDRVADEFLDRPAIAVDDGPRDVEVAPKDMPPTTKSPPVEPRPTSSKMILLVTNSVWLVAPVANVL